MFCTFSELYPWRPMVCVLGLLLEAEPDPEALAAQVAAWIGSHPRLSQRPERGAWLPATPPPVAQLRRDGDDLASLLEPVPPLAPDQPPWRLSIVRGPDSWALRLAWHHALSDGEGMLALIAGALPGGAAVPVPAGQGTLAWLIGLLRETTEHPPLRLERGSESIALRLIETGLTPSDVAELGGRPALVAISAHAVLTSLPQPSTVRILAPSFSTRSPIEPLQLGNHRRRFTRTALSPGPLGQLLRASSDQARRARTTPYAALRAVGRLPRGLVDRLLRRAPPVIVNWDASGLADTITEVAGAPVRRLGFRPPLLPHQGCTFVWWAWRGRMCCSLTVDRALISDVDALQQRLIASVGAVGAARQA